MAVIASIRDIELGHAILDKIQDIYALPESEKKDRIAMGILAGDFSQDDIDYLFARWENYE